MKKIKKFDKYGGKFYRYVPTIIFALAGLFYAFSPYEIKLASGLDFGNSAQDHLVFGVVFLAMAGILWWMNNRKKSILT